MMGKDMQGYQIKQDELLRAILRLPPQLRPVREGFVFLYFSYYVFCAITDITLKPPRLQDQCYYNAMSSEQANTDVYILNYVLTFLIKTMLLGVYVDVIRMQHFIYFFFNMYQKDIVRKCKYLFKSGVKSSQRQSIELPYTCRSRCFFQKEIIFHLWWHIQIEESIC